MAVHSQGQRWLRKDSVHWRWAVAVHSVRLLRRLVSAMLVLRAEVWAGGLSNTFRLVRNQVKIPLRRLYSALASSSSEWFTKQFLAVSHLDFDEN